MYCENLMAKLDETLSASCNGLGTHRVWKLTVGTCLRLWPLGLGADVTSLHLDWRAIPKLIYFLTLTITGMFLHQVVIGRFDYQLLLGYETVQFERGAEIEQTWMVNGSVWEHHAWFIGVRLNFITAVKRSYSVLKLYQPSGVGWGKELTTDWSHHLV